jgi:tetratricopeptide (TPR) repeat protein
MGDVDREIENYKTSLSLDSEDYSVYLSLGEAFEKKGNYQEALKNYRNAYQLNPDSTVAERKIPEMRIKILEKKHKS